MFEKSLYDLIRGLRHHKGNEREYIQNSLRECRAEIKGQDMDLKATALLKLVYLEMFGHDMSWASFNVLEVMSSTKYLQKRVGYLGAVQSFRPETEVLMLATNLLKKDATSASVPTIYLPLITVPHIITPSLALALLPDLMPRLSHSSPNVRKKTLVTLYRLALVYPETLRTAWPRIKSILMTDEEDSSVVSAAINVVCELGWRRPQDFLPLAPRLFDLLVDSGNNWMAIKIIKLFATLTPLEPRLIKKLLPPLTDIIRTTTAMSLLYECIHGIIQGGILDSNDSFKEREEIAELCVSKLQEMISIEGDPNLKYVALLSFNSISISHPYLVAVHQNVIFQCLDDPDISIRSQALDLCSRVINEDNIVVIVDQLMQQLRETPISRGFAMQGVDSALYHLEPAADSEGEDPTETLRPDRATRDGRTSLPRDYCNSVIESILNMCSKDTYANVLDFQWYLNILVELISHVSLDTTHDKTGGESAVAARIGAELRNIAVRVISIRSKAVHAAASLMAFGDKSISTFQPANEDILACAAWVVGEYADLVPISVDVLGALLHHGAGDIGSKSVCACLHAIPKIFARKFRSSTLEWDLEQKATTSIVLARIINFLETLTTHTNLEVQERAMEFLELFRLSREALLAHEDTKSPPLLLTAVFPMLFGGMELGPVSNTAQRKVPAPMNLDLNSPINSSLSSLLEHNELDTRSRWEGSEVQGLYHEKPVILAAKFEKDDALSSSDAMSLQTQGLDRAMVQHLPASARLEKSQRKRDDPYYIGGSDRELVRFTTPIDDIVRSSNGQEIDIDAIPIMDLNLEGTARVVDHVQQTAGGKVPLSKVHVTADENIEAETFMQQSTEASARSSSRRTRQRRGVLQVKSSGLGEFSMEHSDSNAEATMISGTKSDEEGDEMARALAEVEALRMEMQRAAERVRAEHIPDEGTLVKKKTRKTGKKKKKDEAPSYSASATRAGGNDTPLVSKPRKKKSRESQGA